MKKTSMIMEKKELYQLLVFWIPITLGKKYFLYRYKIQKKIFRWP